MSRCKSPFSRLRSVSLRQTVGFFYHVNLSVAEGVLVSQKLLGDYCLSPKISHVALQNTCFHRYIQMNDKSANFSFESVFLLRIKKCWLVVSTHLKHMLVNLDHFPQIGMNIWKSIWVATIYSMFSPSNRGWCFSTFLEEIPYSGYINPRIKPTSTVDGWNPTPPEMYPKPCR